MFIGQGSGTRKGAGGMAQREQKAVLADFRRGTFNTLVATCIGEEGLDIPQVYSCTPLPALCQRNLDTIFCYCCAGRCANIAFWVALCGERDGIATTSWLEFQHLAIHNHSRRWSDEACR